MEQKLIRFLDDHHIFIENKKILVAISGGPDSVALLHFFKQYRYEWNLHIVAVTVNHQLREGAEEDIQYVRHLCDLWNIRLISETVDVKGYKNLHKVSTQVAARKLRYEVFANVMAEEKAHYLALGHHGDDQIETLIMSLMRTTNVSGFTGIPHERPFNEGQIIRPLLAVTKEEIEQYCTRHKLSARIDPSNEDISYTRNYVRKLIVPKLKEKNESLHITMQQLAETLREDETYLQQEAEKVFKKNVRRDKVAKKVTINRTKLSEYAVPLQRRVYRLTLDYLYETLPSQLSYSHEEIFLSLLQKNNKNKLLHFPKGLLVEVVYDQIELYFNRGNKKSFYAYIEDIPTSVPLPNGKVLEVTYTEKSIKNEAQNEYICALSQVKFPLKIRTRIPGDRMGYRGLNGTKKIKDIMIDEKIPRQKRDEIFVLADANGEILWLVGIRKGEYIHPSADEGEKLNLLFTYKD